ncbi:HypC/HybG/HupF family hydrogenase formation chaperone [Streptomyces sp. XY332]|uniref:HypC/HybG/HupF family hydrogenase formation chaperone n=1 Tax=Streptomyces sp. XY332 TaxID=1415561 RepID=UPI0006B1F7C0|nr:HypC/HybG/HupF family hydrogenase formation chaperone [Streptomyces sp. XY332]
MCLAVPGRVLDIGEKDGTRMATVDFGGVVKEVCLEYLPDLQVGEYAIVHVGFALQRLDEESAKQTLELFAQLGMLQEEFGDPWERAAAEAGAGDGDWPFADDVAQQPHTGDAVQEAQQQ